MKNILSKILSDVYHLDYTVFLQKKMLSCKNLNLFAKDTYSSEVKIKFSSFYLQRRGFITDLPD